MRQKAATDWRKLPRKPAALKRSKKIAFRVTEAEWESIRAAAEQSGLPLTDFIITRCIKRK